MLFWGVGGQFHLNQALERLMDIRLFILPIFYSISTLPTAIKGKNDICNV